jgi:ketosteroid isomerase-like protein
MTEESTTPDPVELVRKQVEALDRGDVDGVMSSVAEDGVLDGRADSFEGRAAIRGFLEDWFRAYEELDFELEEVSDLGGGVVFAVVSQDGRLVGGDGHIRQREGWVYLCVGGSIARLMPSEVDQARAAAERLAQERPSLDMRPGRLDDLQDPALRPRRDLYPSVLLFDSKSGSRKGAVFR